MTLPSFNVSANGAGAILDDQLNTFVQGAGLLADARGFVGVQAMTIYLIGLSSPGDGGQGTFYFNASSTATDDGGVTTIQPYGLLTGRWLRLTVGPYSFPLKRTIAFFVPGQPPASQNYVITITEAGTLQNPALNGAGAANVLTNPTTNPVSVVINTIHNGIATPQGTISISSAGVVTFPSFSPVALANGDGVELAFPGSQDATLANVSISLRYTT